MTSLISKNKENENPNLVSRRIYLHDDLDISNSQFDQEKNDVIDLFLQPFETKIDNKNKNQVGMGVNANSNMKQFAQYRQKVDIDSQDDLLNGLMKES